MELYEFLLNQTQPPPKLKPAKIKLPPIPKEPKPIKIKLPSPPPPAEIQKPILLCYRLPGVTVYFD
jgi:hypothetical protein